MKKSAKLFITCPDCALDKEIKKKFKGEIYIISSLAAILNYDEFEAIEEINDLISSNRINKIVFVNSVSCTFLSEILKNKIQLNNPLIDQIKETLQGLDPKVKNDVESLIIENIKRQVQEIKDSAYLGNKIESGDIELSGYLYSDQEFFKII